MGHTTLHRNGFTALALLIAGSGLLCPTLACAQDSDGEAGSVWTLQPLSKSDIAELEGKNFDDIIVFDEDLLVELSSDSDSPLRGLIDNNRLGSSLLFSAPRREDALCLKTGDCRDEDEVSFGISRSFDAQDRSGLEFSLKPRAGVSIDGEGTNAVVGAIVRIGDDLQSGGEIKSGSWYLFAGADAQALTYVPGDDSDYSRERRGFSVQDKVIVGDAQAGVSYKLGEADLSLAYIRREARFEEYKHKEDAAAISITWRH